MRACMPANFLHDVTEHTMEIRQDNEEYRHLAFSKKGDSAYLFHLTTWPGYLCISGDMGCYVFSRLRGYKGKRMTQAEFAEVIGHNQSTVSYRLRSGWTPEQVANTPAHTGNRVASKLGDTVEVPDEI